MRDSEPRLTAGRSRRPGRQHAWSSLMGLLLGLAGCQEPLFPEPPPTLTSKSASRIEIRAHEGRPTLLRLVRDGDPLPSMTLAIYAPGDLEALVALGELWRARGDVFSDVTVSGDALFVSMRSEDAAERGLALLHEPIVSLSEPTRGAIARQLASLPRAGSKAARAVDACRGRGSLEQAPALDPDQPQAATRVEALRKRIVTQSHVRAGLVGRADAVAPLEDALRDGPTWPAGAPIRAAAPERQASVQTAADVTRGVRLSIAVPIAQADAGPVIAKAVARGENPIAARASRLGLSPVALDATAWPGGGCVALSFATEAQGSEAPREPDRNRVTELASLAGFVEAEVQRAAGEQLPIGLAAETIVRTSDAERAARLAGWWALSSDKAGSAPRGRATLLEIPVADGRRPDPADVTLLTNEPKPSVPSAVSVRGLVEQGQEDAWVLVTNPCAITEEPAHLWGSAALAALAVEQKATRSLRPGDERELFAHVSKAGVGFAVRVPVGEPSDSGRAVVRAANRAAGAFSRGRVPSEAVLETRERARLHLDDRWASNAIGLEPLLLAMTDVPSALEPWGSAADVEKRQESELAERLKTLGAGPLSVFVLTPGSSADFKLAAAAVAGWQTTLARPCATPQRKWPSAEVSLGDRGRGPASVRLLVRTGDAALADLVAELLDEGGLLRDAVKPVAGARPTVRALEHPEGALVSVHVAVPPEAITEARTALTALAKQLERGDAPKEAIAVAIARGQRLGVTRRSHPLGRLALLALGTDGGAGSTREPDALRQALRELFKPERLLFAQTHEPATKPPKR